MWNTILGKGTLAASTLGVVLVATYGCDQAVPKCAAGRGAFSAKYTLTGGPGECASLKGEKLGFSTYNARGKEGRPNLDSASIAIQSESLGVLVDNARAAGVEDKDPNHHPYALGRFATSEPIDDFCAVPALADAVQALPEVAGNVGSGVAPQPATSVVYRWTSVRIYVTASAYGTQFSGDLVRTIDGVECSYHVIGMYPYVECGKEDPADANKMIPDDGACAAEANVAEGRPTGSGINPDFPVRCDPELLVCTLAKETIPALR